MKKSRPAKTVRLFFYIFVPTKVNKARAAKKTNTYKMIETTTRIHPSTFRFVLIKKIPRAINPKKKPKMAHSHLLLPNFGATTNK